ncbi:MAG: 4Fe-4S dicluster domain-containing protein [Chloroflexi bacterium]|nr:4Fe-4S dicluster domain-containing protein [Chloroflexota bacterium]
MAKYGMVIDISRCTGCRACMEACKVENNTPQGSFFMYVFRFEEGEYPNTRIWFMPRPCMHCDNPPCVKVCPVGARYKMAEGFTATDWDRCIGCRYCEVACPYGVNYFNWRNPAESHYLNWEDDREIELILDGEVLPYANPDLELEYGPEMRHNAGGGRLKGVVEKCTFCIHRVENGLDPACAANCPTNALHFGDLEDPESEASQILHEQSGFQYLEDVGAEPRVHYVGGHPPTTETREIEIVNVRV